jgi:PAS domain S-box-containing protein
MAKENWRFRSSLKQLETAFGVRALLLLMMAFCVCASARAQQAEPGETTPVAGVARVPAASNGKVSFTTEERQWLSRHDGRIRIGVTLIPPQVLRGNGEGEYKGLSIDYIHIMERKLGCRFKLVPYATWNEVMQAARERRIDMIFAAQRTPERLAYLVFTEPYIELPNMILVRKDRQGGAALEEMKGWSIAASEGSAVHEYLKKEFGYLDLHPAQDELSGLMKVSLGEVDAMVIEISRASYYIEKAGILNLRVAGNAGLLYQLRFAVRNDWPVLRRILDKGLSSITEVERRDISRRWIIVGGRSLFASREFRIAFVAGLGVITLTVLGVIVWNRTLRLIVRQRTSQLQQELAERKKAEGLLNGQKQVLELVAAGAPLPESLTALVGLIEAHAPGMLGSILLLDEEGVHLRHVAAPSLPPEYTAAIDGVSIGPNVGSCGTAAYCEDAVFVEDIATSPLWNEYKGAALPHGLRACWSTPIFDAQRRVLGTFAMYYRQPALPQPNHRRLIDMATHIAAIAIGRHHIEAALRESAERLRLAVQASNVGLWDWDLRKNEVVFSREWKGQLGYEEHEIGNEFGEWERRVNADDLQPATARLHAYLDGKHPEYAVEFRLRHKDGSYRWMYARGEVFRDASGKPTRMLGCHVDTTELKRAEEALRESEEMFRVLADTSTAGIFLYQGERIVYVNPATVGMLGYSEQECLEMKFWDWAHEDFRELVRARGLARQRGEDVPSRYECKQVSKSGEERWIFVSVGLIEYKGKPAGIVTSFDITERKRMEEELRHAREELEKRVEERTSDLRNANELLQRQKRLLEELNDNLENRVGEEVAKNREKDIMLIQQNRQAALGEMLDHIAHQWKQPLNSISLTVQDLGDTASNGELTDEHVEATVGKTIALLEHMAQTIDVFRDFYRPDKEKKVFSIKDSIDQSLAFIAPAFRFHSVVVELDVDPGLTAFGYPKEYAQVLLNILANARDVFRARGTEKPRVTIRAFAEESKTVVTITDNAGGIPETIIGKIFDFYFTTNESAGGTGIGLYMSKNIIEKNMGGTLSVVNTEGGAQFRVEVKLS